MAVLSETGILEDDDGGLADVGSPIPYTRHWRTVGEPMRWIADTPPSPTWSSALTIDYKSIRGTILSSLSLPIARRVVAFKRSTGEFMGETTSSGVDGSFEVLVPSADEAVVVLIPSLGDGKNAVVLDNIVPVAQL